jgi:hypothetical protein
MLQASKLHYSSAFATLYSLQVLQAQVAGHVVFGALVPKKTITAPTSRSQHAFKKINCILADPVSRHIDLCL